MAIAAVPVRPRLRVQKPCRFCKAFVFSNMSYIVYALASRTKNYTYVGFTSNLQVRVARHNNGGEKTTGPYAPFDLIYSESCIDRKTARKRERYWKSGIGREKLREIRKNGDADLSTDR